MDELLDPNYYFSRNSSPTTTINERFIREKSAPNFIGSRSVELPRKNSYKNATQKFFFKIIVLIFKNF